MSATGYLRFLELPADERAILRERARELARVQEEADPGEVLEVLEIPSRGQTYALPLSSVEGISELQSLASVPRAPAFVRGLVGFRGEVLVGIELASFIGTVDTGFVDLRRVIAVSGGAQKLAVLTERDVSVRLVKAASFRPAPLATQPFVRGTDDHLISLLDAQLLVRHVFEALGGGE